MLTLVALGAFGYAAYSHGIDATPPVNAVRPAAETAMVPAARGTAAFRCDGRVHCSQMKSCTEAKYFLANCPGTKMDGDRDGVPCEQQWCRGAFGR